jgi:hypothetical protein
MGNVEINCITLVENIFVRSSRSLLSLSPPFNNPQSPIINPQSSLFNPQSLFLNPYSVIFLSLFSFLLFHFALFPQSTIINPKSAIVLAYTSSSVT